MCIAKYYQSEKCFNREFLLGVLSGLKRFLPLGYLGGYNLPYYTKSKKLTKAHIFEKFINTPNLLSYLPDNLRLTSITREFLLSVLFYGNRGKYLDLYEEYKETEIKKNNTGNKKYAAIVTDKIRDLMREYNPIDL